MQIFGSPSGYVFAFAKNCYIIYRIKIIKHVLTKLPRKWQKSEEGLKDCQAVKKQCTTLLSFVSTSCPNTSKNLRQDIITLSYLLDNNEKFTIKLITIVPLLNSSNPKIYPVRSWVFFW